MGKGYNQIFMKKLDAVSTKDDVDVFIMAASVDSRSYAAFESLVSDGVNISEAIVFDYAKARPEKGTLLYEDYYKLKSLPNVKYILCDEDGMDCRYINEVGLTDGLKIFVDITSISVPDIFRLFYVIKEFHNIATINVVYAEPKYYNYFNGLYFEYEKEIVEREYSALAEYFTSPVSREVILVCFLGFERLISKYIHERKEHTDVIAINGFPAYYPKLKDISLAHNYELISTIGGDCVHYAQANDPFSAYNELVRIKQKNDGKLLDICVLGSKPMALGACMFALKNPDIVKVSYPFPKSNRVHTSIEVSDVWWYKIEL